MTGTVTVTGKIGPELTSTSLVFSEVQDIEYDLRAGVVKITYGLGNKISTYQLSNLSTITMIIAGTTITTTLST